MAKWNFRIAGASFVKELVPVNNDVQYRAESLMQPGFDLEGDKIVIKESGAYKSAVLFSQIGEIDGVNPTDIQDAYDKLLVLVENFNGGGGTPGTTPTLPQVLQQGDRPYKAIPINYTFQLEDISKWIYAAEGGVNTLDDTDDLFLVGCSIPIVVDIQTFKFKAVGTVVYSNLLLDGAPLDTDSLFLYKGDSAELKKLASGVWYLQVTRFNETPLEFQFTQIGEVAPVILGGSLKGARGAGVTDRIRNLLGDYDIVFDLPILADAKDCFKSTNNIQFHTLVSSDGSFFYGIFWYIKDDYTINIKTSDNPTSYSASDSIIQEPYLIKVEYKQ